MLANDRDSRRRRRILASSLLAAAVGGALSWYSSIREFGQPTSGTGDTPSSANANSSATTLVTPASDGGTEVLAASVPQEARAAADMFCGPRCARYVLAHFGRREELYDLIQEIQERDWRRGSSLASINRALRRRGVFTAALRIDDTSILRWPHPAIVHLRGRDAGDIGHFVVQLPPGNGSEARFWCGLAGIQTLPADATGALRSGAVLLTAPSEITLPQPAAVHRKPRALPFVFVISALVGAAISLAICVRTFLTHPRGSRCHE